LGLLARRWPEVVGERLARECVPAALEGGVLLVRASSQAWGAQIRFLGQEIRSAAERVAGSGTIRDVRVAIDAGGPKGHRRGG
jgi:predicted nucleic acid-binding Zn ribbon protein